MNRNEPTIGEDSRMCYSIDKAENICQAIKVLTLRDDPARHVSLDFVLASANGFGFSFMDMRRSQTRITPSDDADANKYGSSTVLSFLMSTTIPFTRAECASSMQYATFPLFTSHAVIFRSSPPVNRSPFCQN